MKLSGIVLLAGLVVGGCSQRNPEKCSDNNHCPDQALPFCDVDGTLGGEPQQCVAVNCAANELEVCRGDQEIRCNATGDNYDVVKCEIGCEANLGCRLCEPNETRCTNGKVGVCDADGTIVSMESCPLGCFLDEPRCRDIDPSNGLGQFLDVVTSKSDLVLENVTIYTESGEVKDQSGQLVGTTSFLQLPSTGLPIRVFVAHDIRLKNVSIFKNPSDQAYPSGRYATGPAVAFVAAGAITVEGRVRVFGGAGGVVQAGCSGGAGQYEYQEGTVRSGGAGGGGHGTAGAKGGAVEPLMAGGAAGAVSGTENLAPLRGGCSSGAGGVGGGAIQLSSRIAVNVKGIIDVRGSMPFVSQDEVISSGGGAGGGILLEAPVVTLDSSSRLIAIGAGGSAGYTTNLVVPDPSDDGTPQVGMACMPPTAYCGAGGNGAAPGVPATPGGMSNYTTQMNSGGGSGGGGLGRIRINTPDRTYTKASSAIEAGVLSTGVLGTR